MTRAPTSHLLRLARAAWLGSLLFVSSPAPAQTTAVPARSVPLLLPSAIAYDASGNLYIAEIQRHDIRKVDTAGNISTVAGVGIQGFAGDGAAADTAQLNSPQGLAVDTAGNLFLSDSGNNRIRRIDAATGLITTIAGGARAAFSGDGGPATSASLSLPRAICLDAAGTSLYIADTRNHRIRRINLATGIITTVAGSGVQGFSGDGAPALSAALDSPDSIALDTSQNLYIADTHNQRIRRVSTTTGLISTVAGSGAVGLAPGSQAAVVSPLALPRGLGLDASGNLYIADAGNHRIVELVPSAGTLLYPAGAGVEGFTGDGTAASSASLDSPRAVALSPGGLVTIADTHNQRIRQLLAAPASATSIQTIAGLGQTVPGLFQLSAPAVVAYGSGTVNATLNTALPATGQVTFLDVTGGSSIVLGLAPLTANTASLSLSTVAAGQHRILATYPGDASHASSQTPTALLTITPLTLTVAPTSQTIAYGAALPTLTGTLTGLLAQDSTRVSALFSTSATPSSAVGSYPISVALTGAAAPDYTLATTPAQLVIHQASSTTLLTTSGTSGSVPGALNVLVRSSTSGTPTGTATLLDNGTTLAQASLTSTGTASFPASTLAAGTHVLSATYAGDGNFLPSTSATLSETIAPPVTADFTLALSGTSSQTLLPGSSISYTLALAPINGGPPSQIALTVSGLPAFTQAAFNPGYIPPGISPTATSTLTITSIASSAGIRPPRSWSPAILVVALPVLSLFWRRRSPRQALPNLALGLAACFLLSSITGCGDRINNTAQAGTTTHSYPITITATATSATGATLQHTTTATLIVTTSQ